MLGIGATISWPPNKFKMEDILQKMNNLFHLILSVKVQEATASNTEWLNDDLKQHITASKEVPELDWFDSYTEKPERGFDSH